MRTTDDRPAAPNFTNACVVLFGVNLMWILLAVWVNWGLVGAMIVAWLVNQTIKHIEARRASGA